jgi:hypothetical protein
VQVDVGIGDARPETAIAEKLQAMVMLGEVPDMQNG